MPTRPIATLLVGAGLCCAASAQSQPWIVRIQCPDGHWSAAHFADRGAGEVVSPGAGRAVRDLRVTALTVLAIAANGSTIRSGPHRNALKNAARWLRANQDDRGRFALNAEPDWILDHAMAATAMSELARVSRYTALEKNVRPALDALTAHLRHFDRGEVDPELLLWCRLAARAARAFERYQAKDKTPDDEPWRSGATDLATQVARLDPGGLPEDRRGRAALLLFEVMADAREEARIAKLSKPLDELGWLAGFECPMTTLYYTFATYQRGGQLWKRLSRRLTQVVVKTQLEDDMRGSWNPKGPFGADSGRVGTSAAATLVLTAYYRYCKLEIGS